MTLLHKSSLASPPDMEKQVSLQLKVLHRFIFYQKYKFFICLYRLEKELTSYEKEISQQQARIQKMNDQNMDSYDIKKQVKLELKFMKQFDLIS